MSLKSNNMCTNVHFSQGITSTLASAISQAVLLCAAQLFPVAQPMLLEWVNSTNSYGPGTWGNLGSNKEVQLQDLLCLCASINP